MKKTILPGFLALFLAGGCVLPNYLTTKDGVRLAYESHPVTPSRGTAILVHGLGSNSDEWYTFSSFLNQAGWSTLTMDLRGHGDSTRWKDESLDWQEMTEAGLRTAERDIESVRELARDPVWLIGSSFGANLAIRFAGRHPGIDGLVLLSPGRGYAGIDPVKDLSRFQGPVFAAGSGEDYQADLVAEEIAAVAPGPTRVRKLQNAGHGSRMLESAEGLDEEIVAWMNQNSA